MCTPQCICEKLGGLGFEEAKKAGKYVHHYSKNLQKLKDKLKDLDDCMEIITREVSVANGCGDEIEVNVSHWQTDANKFKADIEKLMGESTTKASISCTACSCPNIVWRYKFSKQAEEKIAEAVELIGKYNNFNHQISNPRSHYAENLQKLKDKLRDLDDCRGTITRKVSEANGLGDEIEVNVLHWQTDAGSLIDDIEQFIRESTTKANICSTPDITWQYNFSKQAEEKIANADGLIIKYNNFNQISHPRSHYAENLQKLKDKLRDLDDCRETITREVSEANGRGDEIEVNVSHWQTDVGSLKDDIEQLIRESTTKANICSTSECPRPDITWQYNFSKQAEEKKAEADGLIIKYNNFNQISHPRPRPPELESLSDKNYVDFDSRASIFKDIMDALKDSNVNMIGVFGLGGVGKTTLVKEVGEQMRKDGTFKQVAMAVVSKDLNVKEVQSRLAASLNFKFKAELDDQVGRATELWNKLTNGDKYLIILDDIWQEVKMKAIGIPCIDERKCCKVVLTSRNEDLLSGRMEVDKNFSIALLSSAEAWTLFMKKVGNTIESQLEIKSLAYEVCERCKGLPVAINALGEALKGKQEHAWKTALNKLDKYMLKNIVDINPSVFASLRVSYDMLHLKDAKSCFLLCCLFGENAETPLDELTRFWFAGSFLAQKPCTLEEARNDVHTVVDALKSASLLSNGNDENVVKIHDVIRDVGISIAREEEAFLVDHGAFEWPQNPPNGPSYSAISLIFKNVNEHPDGLVYPKLHTLTVVNSKLSDLELPDNFFNGMMQLTVLTISGIRMWRLPSSLAKLKNLRMLYLDDCELDDIAILKDLKSNLEVLRLNDFSIEVLPPEIGHLTSLQVLDLRGCDNLTVIPRGVTSNLTSLEELYFPENFDNWGATTDEQQGTSNRENLSLEELRRPLSTGKLTTLHIYIPDVMLLPKEDLIFGNLKGFKISVGSKIKTSEEIFGRCMLKLEGIALRNEFIPLVDKAEGVVLSEIEGLKEVFHDRGVGNRFLDLKYLKVKSCVEDLKYLLGEPKSSVQSHGLHRLPSFNNLTVLIIKNCKSKYLFSPTTAKGLVHLEQLEVRSCINMEGIVAFEGRNDNDEFTSEVKFCKLEQLELEDLPNLLSFYAQKVKTGSTMGSSSVCAQPLFSGKVIFSVLESLTIEGLDNIITIWDKRSIATWQEQGSFCQLIKLEVKSCSKLMHVFPSNMHPLLKNLKTLEVEKCETMKGIAEIEGERDEDGHRNEVCFIKLRTLILLGLCIYDICFIIILVSYFESFPVGS
ncbi:hypothetical protein RHSIM_Rhsim03G0017300 [Rhododendron simsii]|uniref:NB-ARC domain-containing protein n=1 Tax=Rhododendron simsii TaxID=118357 RepID=A0A834H4X4_RHOSS|nr:hypothetical protein RHSIM_Rhsim03G0017300 [Rhododendron simsii]